VDERKKQRAYFNRLGDQSCSELANMRVKKDRLYTVMLIAGIAVTVLSFIGMLALTRYFSLGF